MEYKERCEISSNLSVPLSSSMVFAFALNSSGFGIYGLGNTNIRVLPKLSFIPFVPFHLHDILFSIRLHLISGF